jgi:hypothetical protein
MTSFGKILVASLAICLLAPGVAMAGTLDQQQTAADVAAFGLGQQTTAAQTFTSGITGGLDEVDLDLQRVGVPTTYFTIEIRDVSGGSPGQAVLAARSLPPSAVANFSPQFIPIQFNPPAPVVAGTQYAIVAYSGNATGNWFIWYVKQSDVYPGGQAFHNNTTPAPPSTYTSDPTNDLAFKTYVVPTPASTPPPTPSAKPTGQRAAALARCKHKHGKARKRCKQRANKLPV